ncbi:uncharacterized protein LOC127807925 [Diospyros lotus]|uniref:uncharacterized protein LOC127807925 n=1 Tax=Diospyros lotus TaxID=55363 RepID=UPI0022561326|nr:uncharacterized protein LOC127807925 [Diospyros lotus]
MEPRSRVWVFPISPSQSPIFQLTHFPIFFFVIFTLTIPITSSIPNPISQIPYAKHCNNVVPESAQTSRRLNDDAFLRIRIAYFAGGDPVLGGNAQESVSFRAQGAFETVASGVFKVEGWVTFWAPRFAGFSGNSTRRRLRLINYRPPRMPFRRRKLGFRLHGFWSESSGKLCMVGSGLNSLHSMNAVLKLHYPNVSTLDTSLVTGTLESLDARDSSNHFEPISMLGLSMMNYQYKLVDRENDNGGFSEFDKMENASLGMESQHTVCSAFRSAGRFELEYMDDCASINCNPLGGGGGIPPAFMFFNEIHCTGNWKGRYLLDFTNSSNNEYRLSFNPKTTLVAEGEWNIKKKHLDIVACRISSSTDSVAKASLGDCSLRLSLRFLAALSLRNRSPVVGQMWSNKSTNDLGHVGRIAFWSTSNGHVRLPDLKYEYSGIDDVRKSCTKEMIGKHKGGTFPNGYSSDMRFDMAVRNSKGQVAWGYSSPLSVGDRFYKPHQMFARSAEPAVQVSNSQSSTLNISYVISFNTPANFKLGGEPLLTNSVEISAEGIYNEKTGALCMVGCRHIESLNISSFKKQSLDCEILISIQYPPLNSKDGSYVEGTIGSRRSKSDSLYFEKLEVAATSIFTNQARESIWRMDLEITMVLITNTLACIFVGMQLFYVKKYPDVLPFISVVMLTVLTLAHMIPLVLNFEAFFFEKHNRQNVFLGSGGWLEVNEVLVRVITMVVFLLHFRLLQQTWSSRVDDGSQKCLWVSDKKVFYLSLPLYVGGGLVAWFVHQWVYSYRSPLLRLRHVGVQQPSIWEDLKSYGGLILDGFLLPQIVFNTFCNTREKALAPSFYMGTTMVRLLPHAYDLYRAQISTWYFDAIYASPRMNYYSTAWDIIISCTGLVFILFIYLQQRFGGPCFLPKRFRDSSVYEKVPVVNSEYFQESQAIIS